MGCRICGLPCPRADRLELRVIPKEIEDTAAAAAALAANVGNALGKRFKGCVLGPPPGAGAAWGGAA